MIKDYVVTIDDVCLQRVFLDICLILLNVQSRLCHEDIQKS